MADVVGEAVLEIGADSSEAMRELSGMEQDVERPAKNAGISFGRIFEITIGNYLAKAMVKLSDMAGQTFKKGFDAIIGGGFTRFKNLDNAEAKFRALNKTTSEIEVIMEKADKSVQNTAFSLDEAATAASMLLTSSVSDNQLQDSLESVTTLASLAGTSMTDISDIIGDMAVSGNVTADAMARLRERNINLADILSTHLGVSLEEVNELVRQGKIDFDTFNEAMKQYSGAAQEYGKTWEGSLKNISSGFARLGEFTLSPTLEQLPGLFEAIVGALRTLNDDARDLGTSIGDSLTPHIQTATEWFQAIADGTTTWSEALDDLSGGAFGKISGLMSDLADDSVSLKEALDNLADGKISEVSDIFKDLADGSETFSGAFDRLKGVIDDVNAKVLILTGLLGGGLLMKTIGPLAAGVGGVSSMFKGLVDHFKKVPAAVAPATTAVSGSSAAASAAAGGFTLFGKKIPGPTGLLKGLGGLLSTHPILSLGGIVAAAGAAFFAAGGDVESFKGGVDKAKEGLKTFSENLPGYLEAGLGFVTEMVDTLVQQLPVIVPKLTEGLGKVIDAVVAGIQTWVPVLVDAAITLFTALVDAIPQILPPLIDALTTLLTELIRALTTFIPTLVQAAVDLFMALVEAIPEVLPTLIKGVKDLIKAVVDVLPTLVSSLLDAAVELFTAIVEALPEILPDLLKGLVDIIKALAKELPTFIGTLLEAGTELFMALVDALIDIIPDLVKTLVTDVIPALVGAIVEGGVALFNAGKELAGEILSGIANGISNGVTGTFKNLGIEPISNGLIKDGPKLGELMADLGMDMMVNLSTGWTSNNYLVANSAQNTLNTVQEKINFEALKQAGADLWNGFVNGAQGAWAGVATAMSTSATNTVNVVKGVIHSSTLTGVGQNFYDGFVRGVRGAEAGGNAQLRDTAIRAVRTMQAVLTSTALNSSGRMLIGGAVSGVTGGWAAKSGAVRDVAYAIPRQFSSLGTGTLWGVGRSLMNGLLSGINSGWSGVSARLGAITAMIPRLKGPPEKDKKLLTNSGELIMQGLGDGLDRGWKDIEDRLGLYTSKIAGNSFVSPSRVLGPSDVPGSLSNVYSTSGAMPDANGVSGGVTNNYYNFNINANDVNALRKLQELIENAERWSVMKGRV